MEFSPQLCSVTFISSSLPLFCSVPDSLLSKATQQNMITSILPQEHTYGIVDDGESASSNNTLAGIFMCALAAGQQASFNLRKTSIIIITRVVNGMNRRSERESKCREKKYFLLISFFFSAKNRSLQTRFRVRIFVCAQLKKL